MQTATIKPRVLVCGGRDFGWSRKERDFIFRTLDRLFVERGWSDPEYERPDVVIISGEAPGVDSVATDYAVVNWTGYEGYPADWERFGPAAGPIRNEHMLRESEPDLVIAFPGGKGTAHMVKIAREAGVEVVEVAYDV